MIEKVGTQYVLYSRKTHKRLSKPGSLASVKKREGQVEYFKNTKKAFGETPVDSMDASAKTLQTDSKKKSQANRINNTDAYKGHDGEDFIFPELQEGPPDTDRGNLAASRKGHLEKAEKGTAAYQKWIMSYRQHHPVQQTIDSRFDIAKQGTKPIHVNLDLIDKKIDSLVRDNLYAKEGLRAAHRFSDTASTRTMITENERKLAILNALKDAHISGNINFKEGVLLHVMPDEIRSVFKAKDGYRLVSVKVTYGKMTKGVDAFKLKVADIYQELIQGHEDMELLYPHRDEVLLQVKKSEDGTINKKMLDVVKILRHNVEGFTDFRPLSVKSGDNWGELTR